MGRAVIGIRGRVGHAHLGMRVEATRASTAGRQTRWVYKIPARQETARLAARTAKNALLVIVGWWVVVEMYILE
jgi:hypothetical protein